MKFLDKAWRTGITSFCFFAFGVGGCLLSLFMACAAALPLPRLRRQQIARSIVGFFFRTLVRFLCFTGCMRLDVKGLDRLKMAKGCLILANHPSYIDIVVLISLFPQANCVVKGSHWRNPFYWGIVRATGYIRNTSPETMLDSCSQVLHKGESLVIFPEGTRSQPGRPMQFTRGVAHLALRSQPPVLPILIHCDPPTQTKDQPFWRVPRHQFTCFVQVLEPVSSAYFCAGQGVASLDARRFTQSLQDYFSEKLISHGYA